MDLNIVSIPTASVGTSTLKRATPKTASASKEDSKYQQFTVTNGHGQVANIQAEVTKGASAEVMAEVIVHAVSISNFDSWKKNVETKLSTEQKTKLKGIYAGGGGAAAGYLSSFIGLVFGGAAYVNHNKTVDYSENLNDKQKEIAKSMHDLTDIQVKLQGKVRVVGTSNIPTRGAVFVETTKVAFKDGKSIHVLNTSAVAATPEGSRNGIETESSNLHQIPLE